MVNFGILVLCICVSFLFVMLGLLVFIEFMHKWNDEKLRVERHEEQKKTIGFDTEDKKEDDEKEDEFISPFDLTKSMLDGKINIDEQLKR